jgi:hypothetical protein
VGRALRLRGGGDPGLVKKIDPEKTNPDRRFSSRVSAESVRVESARLHALSG